MLGKRFTGSSRPDAARDTASAEARELTSTMGERDATIARLEQTLAEHEANIEALRDALERAKFNTKILEQSYATQLAEARERAAAAEQSATEKQTRLVELEASHEVLSKEFAEARKTLESYGPDAVSIDAMLASFAVPRDRPLARDSRGEVDAPAGAEVVEEMLAPNVMFAAKTK